MSILGKIVLRGGRVNFSDYFVKPNYTVMLTSVGGSLTEMTPGKAGDVIPLLSHTSRETRPQGFSSIPVAAETLSLAAASAAILFALNQGGDEGPGRLC